jgi:serine/threonine-protein kinase HipA
VSVAEVRLWGRRIGAVSWDARRGHAWFEYDKPFLDSGIQLAPLAMPLAPRIHGFPELARESFHGLPGLLADSLPDDFGNAVIDAWLEREGRAATSFNPVDRLCFIGRRGMGALEYQPAIGPVEQEAEGLDVGELVVLASEILQSRLEAQGSFAFHTVSDTLDDILRVGSSAGGVRAKAVIAWNPDTGEVRSGPGEAGEGFSCWLLKLDGIAGNRDKEHEDPAGYNLIEYAYYRMAQAAGIRMQECRLLEEGGRQHFLTRRFDRTDSGGKLHMATLAGLAHFDYRRPGANSYEEALRIVRQLELGMDALEELFRRMAFNIVARNQNDHARNLAFLMDRKGRWSLAPAYDLSYSHTPGGTWTGQHQLSLNGKRDAFTREDFRACAKQVALKRGRDRELLEQVCDAVAQWPSIARELGIPDRDIRRIGRNHRLQLRP